jgi:hypothetical protein
LKAAFLLPSVFAPGGVIFTFSGSSHTSGFEPPEGLGELPTAGGELWHAWNKPNDSSEVAASRGIKVENWGIFIRLIVSSGIARAKRKRRHP